MSFKPYPKYKESGVEWLGRVPEHWEVGTGRRLFAQKRDPALAKDEQLSATQKYGVLPQQSFMEMEDQKVALALTGTSNFKHVEKNDFVISLRSFQGGIERSLYSGCVSPAYTVLRPTQTMDGGFWGRLLKSSGYVEALQTMTDGIRDGKTISYQQFGRIGLPLPPLAEQAGICTFLDHETAKIDALIAEQQRLIELLQEKRQAVISHAVTKGLNPDAPMKDSGIEWLGEMPEHWDVTRFKRIAAVGNGSTPSRERPDYWEGGDYPWLNSAVVNNSPVDPPGQFVTPVALAECHLPRVQPPAVLVGLTGQGRTRGMASLLLYEATVSQHLGVLVPRAGMKAAFLKRVLDMAYPYLRRDSEEAGSTKGAITCEALANFALASPPADEQREISEYLDDQSRLFDALAGEALEGIALLQERRSALISAAVTGQIDVRDFASGGSEAA